MHKTVQCDVDNCKQNILLNKYQPTIHAILFSNKANLLNFYPQQRVILEKRVHHKI